MRNAILNRNLTDTIRQSFFIILISLSAAIGANLVRTDGIPFIGDWSIEVRFSLENGETSIIQLPEAMSLFQKNQAVFLDARDKDQFEQGHIKGAINLPWYSVDHYFADVTADLSLDTIIITYCDGEACPLSHDLADFLRNMGFSNTRVLINGWSAWRENHLPIESKLPE